MGLCLFFLKNKGKRPGSAVQQMLLNQVQQPETSMGKNEKKTNAGKQGKAAVVEAEEIEQNPGRLTFVLLILGFP